MTATTTTVFRDTPETNQKKGILQDIRSGLYFSKERGGFSEPDKDKATVLEDAPTRICVKHSFMHPEFITTIILEDEPTPENAHKNKHLDGSIRAKKIRHDRDGQRAYVFGDWQIRCYNYNQHKGAHPYIKLTTRRLVPMWHAWNKTTKEELKYQHGGIRLAVNKITKHEMKRHSL